MTLELIKRSLLVNQEKGMQTCTSVWSWGKWMVLWLKGIYVGPGDVGSTPITFTVFSCGYGQITDSLQVSVPHL